MGALSISHLLCLLQCRLEQGRNRTRRIEEVVLPEIESLKPAVSKRVFDEMRAAQMRGSKKELNMFHAKKCISIVGHYFIFIPSIALMACCSSLRSKKSCSNSTSAVHGHLSSFLHYPNYLSSLGFPSFWPDFQWTRHLSTLKLSSPSQVLHIRIRQ